MNDFTRIRVFIREANSEHIKFYSQYGNSASKIVDAALSHYFKAVINDEVKVIKQAN